MRLGCYCILASSSGGLPNPIRGRHARVCGVQLLTPSCCATSHPILDFAIFAIQIVWQEVAYIPFERLALVQALDRLTLVVRCMRCICIASRSSAPPPCSHDERLLMRFRASSSPC